MDEEKLLKANALSHKIAEKERLLKDLSQITEFHFVYSKDGFPPKVVMAVGIDMNELTEDSSTGKYVLAVKTKLEESLIALQKEFAEL